MKYEKAILRQHAVTVRCAKNQTIKFMNDSIQPTSVEEACSYAFRMHSTIVVGDGKNHRPQRLGVTRSLQDLYLICKHYVPNVTIYDVVKRLSDLYKQNSLYSHYCCTFRRMMFKDSNNYYFTRNHDRDLKRYSIIE